VAYERTKAEIHKLGNTGPRLDKFDLASWDVGDRIAIPLKANGRGKLVPEDGFNVKAANALHGPDKKFRKWRDESKGVLFVQRIK
jgi:hypothetical protein